MKPTIWMSIATTPWWMYVFVIYVFLAALYSTYPAIMPIKRLLQTTILFTLITAGIIFYSKSLNLSLIMQLFTLLLLSIGIGWLSLSRKKILACPKTNSLHLPGSWGMAFILLAALAYKYFSGYEIHYDLNYYKDTSNINYTQSLLLYSVVLGLFIGRYAYARYCLKNGPFIPQKPLTFEQ